MDKPTLAPESLELLVCPISRAPLVYDSRHELLSARGAIYPVIDGIPQLRTSDARPVEAIRETLWPDSLSQADEDQAAS